MSTDSRAQNAPSAQDPSGLADSSPLSDFSSLADSSLLADPSGLSASSHTADSSDLADSSELITITKGELDSLYQRALTLTRVVGHFYETMVDIKLRMRRINTIKRRALRLTGKLP